MTVSVSRAIMLAEQLRRERSSAMGKDKNTMHYTAKEAVVDTGKPDMLFISRNLT